MSIATIDLGITASFTNVDIEDISSIFDPVEDKPRSVQMSRSCSRCNLAAKILIKNKTIAAHSVPNGNMRWGFKIKL